MVERRDFWENGRFDTSRFDTNSSSEIAQKISFTLSIDWSEQEKHFE